VYDPCHSRQTTFEVVLEQKNHYWLFFDFNIIGKRVLEQDQEIKKIMVISSDGFGGQKLLEYDGCDCVVECGGLCQA
jgi:hypothetical protein